MTKKNKIFYFGILPGLFIQLIGAYFYFVLFSQEVFAKHLYLVTKILIVIWPLIWWYLFKTLLVRKKPEISRTLSYGLASGIVIAACTFALYFFFGDYFRQFSANFTEKAVSLGILENYIIFAFFLSVIHSFIEEYYWRWFIFRGLMLKLTPVWAAVIGSAAFSAHHFVVLSEFFPLWLTLIFGLAVFGGGLFWCGLYYKTKSLYGSWLSHFFVDVAVMTVGYFLMI